VRSLKIFPFKFFSLPPYSTTTPWHFHFARALSASRHFPSDEGIFCNDLGKEVQQLACIGRLKKFNQNLKSSWC
jgi:hypothetical protein